MSRPNENSTPTPMFFSAYPITDLAEMIIHGIIEELLPHLPNMSNALNPDELLTRKQAALEFGISVASLDNYVRDGLIVPCRPPSGTRPTRIVRFRRGDLQAFFSSNILNPYKVAQRKKR
jgi:hypothetical protein